MIVDARGLTCPLPVIRLAAAARDAAPGTTIVVLWTDPAAQHDIPAWARMRGHTVVEDTAGRDIGGRDAGTDAPGVTTVVIAGPRSGGARPAQDG